MTKATFTGYFPKLKAHREATVKSGKAINPKGSIRYQIKGECMDDEKGLCISLPKMVTREDFENVYGFDAKEAESVFMADTVGSPSPADVEPPAPSEKPFPQEPSNENFSADNEAYYREFELRDELEMYDAGDLNDMIEELVIADGGEKEWLESYGYEDWSEANLSKKDAINAIVFLKMKSEEVKEAFGLFGDKDEEKEEEKEPETQEFTVVLQEGDKLELTDVEETADTKDEDEGADEENEEKASDCDDHFYEAEAPSFRHKETGEVRDYNTMMKIGMESSYDEIIKMNQEWEAIDADGNVVEFEAVQAKVTRPVKEDETEDEEEEESEEGMSTLTKVGLGVGALAIGAAILGAEDEGELDYWDGENAEWRAEGGGQIDHDSIDTIEDTEVHFRHDNPTTDYEWTSGKDELTDDEEDIVDDEVRWDIGSEPSEGEDSDSIDVDGVGTVHYTKDTDYGDKRFYGLAAEGEDFQKMTPSEFVPFDQMQEELGQMWDETTAPLADAHNYDYEPSNEPSNANFSAEWTQEDDDKWNEERSRRQEEIEAHEGLDNLHEYSHVGSYEDYQKEHQAIIRAWKKALQEGQDDGKSPEDLYWINDAWVKQITELNRYWSDIDSGKYHAQYPIATLSAEGWVLTSPRMGGRSGVFTTKEDAEKVKNWYMRNAPPHYEIETTMKIVSANANDGELDKRSKQILLGSETVGSPSPSGPSSVPEPAEATGSEPSNEHMEADSKTKNMVLGTVALGIGLSVILGKDRINKMFDRFGL